LYHMVFRNATIVDGTGSPGRTGDVALRNGRIAEVGDVDNARGEREIDCSGLVLCPGFIDAHAHSDFALAFNPTCESQVAQGVTTEVMGNCGYSPFPITPKNRGLTFDPPEMPVSWSTIQEYMRSLPSALGINVVSQVGHTTIRAAVAGKEDRKLTADEIREVRRLAAEAVGAGARGLSTGLDYPPGGSADLEELVSVVSEVASRGGFYSSHVRGYSGNLLNAVEEAIEIGRRTGATTIVSHLGAFGRCNWGKAARAIEMIAEARARGQKVYCDLLLYPTSGAWWAPRAVLPESDYDWKKGWADNVPEIAAKLRDPAERARLAEEIEKRRAAPKKGFHEEFLIFNDWRDIYLQGVRPGSPNSSLVGKNMEEIGRAMGREPCEAFFELIMSEGKELSTTHFGIDENELLTILRDEYTMISTDTVATSLEKADEPFNVLQSHPRHYGTFPRLFERYVRSLGVLPLEEAVRRVTSLPARVFGLKDRGVIRPGAAADIVVFDPDHIAERGTYLRPGVYPDGIEYISVNGVLAVDRGSLTRACGGRVL